MIDILVTLLVIVIIAAAVRYIIKQKKSGAKCIGCSSGCSCGCSTCSDAESLKNAEIRKKE